ncbi:MAG TPA: cytochrome C biogenesis protein [Microscillaceae bacterium]|nr:cytochrome C biogenesis protein [Microscillaceae bacterium]
MNLLLGNVGHFAVITAFLSAFLATFGYWKATLAQQQSLLPQQQSWNKFARIHFYIHALAVVAVIVSLFSIIYLHRYEYHYAWSHSSNNLPVYYMISCFWEGQEGSFLLWIFWHVCLGLVLMAVNQYWENPLMAVFTAVQCFLTSMILGVVIFQVKIGSSPFVLMREVMNIPIFQMNPNFVPEDGKGLNPLLQNYWMVIHPPTLFLGFATTLVPFAYCMAGLWQQKYKEWVRPALPWALFSAAVLGLGILMGGYWAYETLNFGGYWNWDPVENAVYVPWLVLVAAIHTMISFKNSSTALKAAIILTIGTFILILYATFLTRSGILGNASVHSFTDLGLSGQLLVYLLVFTILSMFLLIRRWKSIPTSQQELSMYSREFWIFLGATVLCLASFQVLFTTSIPVYNALIESFGFVSNIALPADPISHYTKIQLWGAVLVGVLSGTGQFFWWNKMDKAELVKVLMTPVLISLLATAALMAVSGIHNFIFIILLTTSVYSITANLAVFWNILKNKNIKIAGGSVAHIGLAMMLIGILFSSGYSRVISLNTSGLVYSKEFSKEMNEENVLLWLNRPITMPPYQVTYRGLCLEAYGFPSYIPKNKLLPGGSKFEAIAKEDISYQGKKYFAKGQKIQILPENTYYEVEYRDANGRIFQLFPRAQVNPSMGLIASPDIHRFWGRDLYTHVSSIPDPTAERNWSKTEEFTVKIKDTLFVNDYVAVLEAIEPLRSDELLQLTGNQEAGMKANLKILGENRTYQAQPKFYIKNEMIGREPEIIEELGLKITLLNVKPDEKSPANTQFVFGVNTSQKDYIVMKAMEKPLINILWIGTLVLMLGFGIAIARRYTEFVKMRNKGQE